MMYCNVVVISVVQVARHLVEWQLEVDKGRLTALSSKFVNLLQQLIYIYKLQVDYQLSFLLKPTNKAHHFLQKLIAWQKSRLSVIIRVFLFIMIIKYWFQHFQIYLPWEDFYKDSVVIIGIVHWPSFIMVLNTLIPISLYIR